MFSEIKELQARLWHLAAARGRVRVAFAIKMTDLKELEKQDRLAELVFDSAEESLLHDLIKATPLRMDFMKDFGYKHEEIATC